MKILVKIYEHEWIDTVLTQELIDSEVVIDDDLSTFSIAKFQLPMIPVQEDNKIELYEITNIDKLIFRGFVYKIEPVRKQFNLLNIECRSEKAIFNKRLFLKDKQLYSGHKVASLPTIGARGIPYWDGGDYVHYAVSTEHPKGGSPFSVREGTAFTDTTFFVDIDGGHLWKWDLGVITDEGVAEGVDIKLLLQSMFDDYVPYGENWTFDCNFDYQVVINMKKGDNYFDLLDELAEQTGAVWDIQDGVVIFKQNFGKDYSISGPDYQEINYNGLYPNNSNIKNISLIGTATRSNIVIGEDNKKNIIIDDTGVTDRIYGVEKASFREGDLQDKVTSYLSKVDIFQRVFSIEVEQNSINVNVGDIVKVNIENTNSYYDLNSSVMIIKKNTRYTLASKIINYTIGTLNVYPITLQNRLYGVQKSLKYLKLG